MNYRARKLVKPEDLNSKNTLFGGKLLSWVDEEAYIFASCQLETEDLVTKFISDVDFLSPARQGDVVEIGMELIKIGRTSIVLACNVRNRRTRDLICEVKKIVFVCVDEEGRAKVHGKVI